jgi:hypothetical protein
MDVLVEQVSLAETLDLRWRVLETAPIRRLSTSSGSRLGLSEVGLGPE